MIAPVRGLLVAAALFASSITALAAPTEVIAKQIYPEQFADIDPIASLRAFHERFLPVPFAGTWMVRL